MKLYDNLSVETQFQNNGTKWYLVLRGPEDEINLTLNSLANYGGIGEYTVIDWCNAERTMAVCLSGPKSMYRYFFSRHFVQQEGNDTIASHFYAKKMMILFRRSATTFMTWGRFANMLWDGGHDTLGIGKATAEAPDRDFKDECYARAYRPQNSVSCLTLS